MSGKKDYDAIIIGAGISGLVCGCYLAKAGMKTLIVEKNARPGGYCTSFKRGGVTFDACVHSLGSLREGGIFSLVLQELDVKDKLNIKRHDPSDIIIAPDNRIHFWNDLSKTIQEFQEQFPAEAFKIKEFFEYIDGCEGLRLVSLRAITFETLLNRYLKDEKLKAILSLPLLGNGGLPAKRMSAFMGVMIYKEFMFDGGYYPDGSIQSLADILLARFKDLGGSLSFSRQVEKIRIKDGKVEGIELDNKDEIASNCVVSCADSTQMLRSLMGKEVADEATLNLLESMEPSLSAFILYLGVDSRIDHFPKDSVIWFLPHYDMNKIYNCTVEGKIVDLDWFLSRLSSSNNSLFMLVNVPFNNSEYWKVNKEMLIDIFIEKMGNVYPNLSRHVIIKDAATPNTLQKWTLNYKGAAYGWASIPSQIAISDFSRIKNVENLYVTGQWTTSFHGVGGVAYLGRETSRKILRKERAS
jgi:prolycopene isomerase